MGPFKSLAQKKHFAAMAKDGKISKETLDHWNKETGSKKLPERAPGPNKVRKVKVIK